MPGNRSASHHPGQRGCVHREVDGSRGDFRVTFSQDDLALIPLCVLLAGCRSAPGDRPGATAAAVPQRADVRFTDVAAPMGLRYRWKSAKKSPMNILEISSAGAGFIDYNGDGWPDIVLVGPEGCARSRR